MSLMLAEIREQPGVIVALRDAQYSSSRAASEAIAGWISVADFLHDPIASVHADDPCFVIAPSGKAAATTGDALARLHSRSAETVVISDRDELLASAVIPIRIKTAVEEELTPLLYIVPGQLFAYYLSTTRGLNPDSPRGLSKVTLTL